MLTSEYIIEGWLTKNHGITISELESSGKYPNDSSGSTRQFYDDYQVTQEQHDDWEIWAKEAIVAEELKTWYEFIGDDDVSEEEHQETLENICARVNRGWWMIYLNVSPKIKE